MIKDSTFFVKAITSVLKERVDNIIMDIDTYIETIILIVRV